MADDAVPTPPTYQTLTVTRPFPHVAHVVLNRPAKRNAVNTDMWRDLLECFDWLSTDKDSRVIVLSGNGELFCAGLDLGDASSTLMSTSTDAARTAFSLRPLVLRLQESFNAIERCIKPVIAAVHSKCIGAGVDMITACDIRMCSSDAQFVIKEVDIGLCADVGTLQRIPKIMGHDSLVRELAYTGRALLADQALSCGLVSQVHPDRERLLHSAFDLAKVIASKSPIAVFGTKHNINYSRDHTVAESLQYIATWNSAMLQTEDIPLSISSKSPLFSKL